MRREKSIAKVVLGRQNGRAVVLDVAKAWDYAQLVEFGSHSGQLATGHGVQ
jgi:hypothetical protein